MRTAEDTTLHQQSNCPTDRLLTPEYSPAFY